MKYLLSSVLFAVGASVAFADPAAAPGQPAPDDGPAIASADIFVYAARGQSDKQLDRDRYECHNWAVAQTRYNPSDPHLAPHQQIQVVAVPDPPPPHDTVVGAMAGAMIGAAIGSPHDAAQGAVVGAIAGGAMGAASDSARQKQAQHATGQNNATAQAERARLEQQASDYRRAISACLEGRGYTVK
ncbi:MAG TPA: glycine zipper 2TM domain-containing protein [Steroidobacteraceae bacterium]